MNDKYTFEDWFSGKVNLKSEQLFRTNKNTPIVKELSNFSSDDQVKILETKEKIFDELVNNLKQKFINDFEKRFKNSLSKKILLSQEIEEVYDILFGELESKGLPYLSIYKKTFFEENEILNLKFFIRNIIIEGDKINIEFIHSPNSKFREVNEIELITPIEVLAIGYYLYLKYLEKTSVKQFKAKHINNYKKSINQEPTNIAPNLFIDGWASELFNELIEVIALKKRNSDFAYIYEKFKEKSLFINQTEKKFYCNFVNKKFELNLNNIKLRYRENKTNEEQFLRLYFKLYPKAKFTSIENKILDNLGLKDE